MSEQRNVINYMSVDEKLRKNVLVVVLNKAKI